MEADKAVTATQTETTSPASVTKTKAQKTSAPGWMAWGFVLALALAGVAATAYLWQMEASQQQRLQTSVAAAVQRVDSEVAQAREIRRELDQQKMLAAAAEKNLQQQIQALQAALHSQQKQLQSMSTTDREDWLLAEVEYLIRLANQRLLMGEDIASAAKLLRAADEIIRELDDAALYGVRKIIAEDRVALQAATTLDIEGLYLQVAAVAVQAAKLRLYQPPELLVETQATQFEGGWRQKLGQGFTAAWEKLSSYIQIHRRDEKYSPVLAPEYEEAVRQNVQLMFEQAQLALLSGNQALYRHSLDRAEQWLQDYYTVDLNSTIAVIDSLKTLQEQNITIVVPDISRSLRQLKNYIEMIHAVSIADKPVESAP